MRVFEVELMGLVRVGATLKVEAENEAEARDIALSETASFTFPWDHRMYSDTAENVEITDICEIKP